MVRLKCEYCCGQGYVMVDVGQLFECHRCNASGYVDVNEQEEEDND